MYWYHHRLRHLGEKKTEKTINKKLTLHGLITRVRCYYKQCPQCQMTKRLKNKYGHFLLESIECIPWKKVCVDCICLYKGRHKKEKCTFKFLEFHYLTMIDLATG